MPTPATYTFCDIVFSIRGGYASRKGWAGQRRQGRLTWLRYVSRPSGGPAPGGWEGSGVCAVNWHQRKRGAMLRMPGFMNTCRCTPSTTTPREWGSWSHRCRSFSIWPTSSGHTHMCCRKCSPVLTGEGRGVHGGSELAWFRDNDQLMSTCCYADAQVHSFTLVGTLLVTSYWSSQNAP